MVTLWWNTQLRFHDDNHYCDAALWVRHTLPMHTDMDVIAGYSATLAVNPSFQVGESRRGPDPVPTTEYPDTRALSAGS
jgi:hypothetical protein